MSNAIQYLTELKPGDDTKVQKVSRFPSGWFVTTQKQMHGPFHSKTDAQRAIEARIIHHTD